ncbi:feather keratin 4-like [Apteryx rowi]|uniref:feather keratin 4-like n=1 Tax=Apteryx rowi TaxID=308060 RepID=UPI000E1C9A78|nr:feather keratin 4-like [Apteryx rowi]
MSEGSLLPAGTMSFYKQACDYRPYPSCDVSCPAPYANAWNQPCVTSCGDSRAVVYPPPVVITFPGPILSSCPQESYVGSSAPLELGGSFGQGNYLGASSSFGSSVSLGSGYSYPCYSRRSTTYRRGSCGPC